MNTTKQIQALATKLNAAQVATKKAEHATRVARAKQTKVCAADVCPTCKRKKPDAYDRARAEISPMLLLLDKAYKAESAARRAFNDAVKARFGVTK